MRAGVACTMKLVKQTGYFVDSVVHSSDGVRDDLLNV